jgi:hypothetical protein
MSRFSIAAMLVELFLYVCARFCAPRRPCSSPAKAVKIMEARGLWRAKMRASSRETATPDALNHVSISTRGLGFWGRGGNVLIDCARGVAFVVHGIAIPRVVMPAREVIPLWILAAPQRRYHSRYINRKQNPLIIPRILNKTIPSHAHRPVTRRRGGLELRGEPVSRRADAAIRVCLGRERVSGAEGSQFAYCGFDVGL